MKPKKKKKEDKINNKTRGQILHMGRPQIYQQADSLYRWHEGPVTKPN